jgi:PKD repeat protein
MKEKTKKMFLAVELTALVLLSAFVVSLFPNKTESIVENQLPMASISVDKTSGEAPIEVSFTGSGIDNDGSIESYYWDFGGSSTSDLKNPKYLFGKEGEYVVCLTVRDNHGAEATDYITISVVEEKPLGVIASATYDFFNSVAPLYVQFYGRVTGGSGEIVSYHWEFNGKILNHESNDRSTSRVYFTPGWHTARITVTDSEGNTSTDTVMFEVTGYTEWFWNAINEFFDLLPKRR